MAVEHHPLQPTFVEVRGLIELTRCFGTDPSIPIDEKTLIRSLLAGRRFHSKPPPPAVPRFTPPPAGTKGTTDRAQQQLKHLLSHPGTKPSQLSKSFSLEPRKSATASGRLEHDQNLKPASGENPISGQPAPEKPVVEQPAVEQPVVEQPAVEQPAVKEPAVEQPAVEQPAVEEPVVEEPAVEKPVVEQPAVEKPVVEQPAVEKAVVEQPAVEEPAVEKPVVEQPAAEEAVRTSDESSQGIPGQEAKRDSTEKTMSPSALSAALAAQPSLENTDLRTHKMDEAVKKRNASRRLSLTTESAAARFKALMAPRKRTPGYSIPEEPQNAPVPKIGPRVGVLPHDLKIGLEVPPAKKKVPEREMSNAMKKFEAIRHQEIDRRYQTMLKKMGMTRRAYSNVFEAGLKKRVPQREASMPESTDEAMRRIIARKGVAFKNMNKEVLIRLIAEELKRQAMINLTSRARTPRAKVVPKERLFKLGYKRPTLKGKVAMPIRVASKSPSILGSGGLLIPSLKGDTSPVTQPLEANTVLSIPSSSVYSGSPRSKYSSRSRRPPLKRGVLKKSSPAIVEPIEPPEPTMRQIYPRPSSRTRVRESGLLIPSSESEAFSPISPGPASFEKFSDLRESGSTIMEAYNQMLELMGSAAESRTVVVPESTEQSIPDVAVSPPSRNLSLNIGREIRSSLDREIIPYAWPTASGDSTRYLRQRLKDYRAEIRRMQNRLAEIRRSDDEEVISSISPPPVREGDICGWCCRK